MLRLYCDKCKKQCKNNVQKVIKACDGDSEGNTKFVNDYIGVDLCEKCYKELNELVVNFMKTK